MQAAVRERRGIPFFYDKTASEFQQDIYERYGDMVLRQTALHLADELWGTYPVQVVFDAFFEAHLPESLQHILEIGCSVGRWIATLAQRYPEAVCWGMDYSYQMLKRAREFWLLDEELTLDFANKGFPKPLKIQGHQLSNLQFGLCKAAHLPFDDDSQDLVMSSFLLDRLDNPTKGLAEMQRVLKKGGKLFLLSPLNFAKASHWNDYYPAIKIYVLLEKMGFKILDWKEDVIIQEPLDAHGNLVRWKCLGLVAEKL